MQKGGLKVLIAACDTFRAGAVEQLRTHARFDALPSFACMHAFVHLHACMHAFVHLHACIHTFVHACIYSRMHAFIHAFIDACVACIY